MGIVYHAIDPNIGRPVAIKVIRLTEMRNPEEQERVRERLFREARSAGMLSHPGIVTIYDVEQQGDIAYIAMEYVDGPTLDATLSKGPLSSAEVFSYLGQNAVALDYAHSKGIVHRDIKPSNIMIASDGMAKITDFGIAKITSADQFTLTGTIVGTPHYMSPEQVQGLAVDGRSDQFSLAVIAYEMLTGEKPYGGEHLTTVVYKIVAEEPVPPHRLNPTLAGPIENVLKKGLAKKPEARYRTCQEFSQALEKACVGSRGWKTMARGGSLVAPTLAEARKPVINLPPPARRREATTTEHVVERRSRFAPFLATLLLIAGLLAFVGWRMGSYASLFSNEQPVTPSVLPSKPVTPDVPSAPTATAGEKPSPMAPTGEPQAPAQSPADTSAVAQTPPTPTAKVPPVVSTKAPPVEGNTPATTPAVSRPDAGAPKIPARTVPLRPSVTVVSSPSGATAMLDGRSDIACTTPCSLDAMPGRHVILLTMQGYETERREVDLGSGPVELPAVILRAPGGTLLLTTVPAGASIAVNGKKVSQITPAQLSLPPGTYNITVEKDGKQSTRPVEVRNGLSYLKIQLD